MRTFLLQSRSGRALCFLILALFLILCGLHLSGSHHDDDGDGFGFAEQVILLVAIVSGLAGAAIVRRGPPTFEDRHFWSMTTVDHRARSLFNTLESPLRC